MTDLKAFKPTLPVGTPVLFNSHEGFGGYGYVCETRDAPLGICHKVRLTEGTQQECWALDAEIEDLRPGAKPPQYDSRPDTYQHIQTVQRIMGGVVRDLMVRAERHDQSKLVDPEKATFDEYTPKLKHSTYGSEEYKSFLAGMKPALDHHYAANSHHPEHYADGIRGMSLLDLVEMLCDWKAATMRHADGDIRKSIDINQKRFGYGDELKRIFLNTLTALPE